MSAEPSKSGGPITLDQWIALNDELIALVHAGVPLDRGLINAGREMNGESSAAATRIGTAIESGKSLEQALADEGDNLPELYRAVVAAGIRSGRLSLALESMATFARGVAETRRAVGAAIFYPLCVMTAAYACLVLFLNLLLPRFLETFEVFRLEPTAWTRMLHFLADTQVIWLPIFPAILVIVTAAWFYSNHSSQLRPGRLWGLFRFVPGMRRIIENAQAANVAELLGLLVEQEIPLDQALRLAADASGEPGVRQAVEELARDVERGESVKASFYEKPGMFPPLLRWVLATGSLQSDLPSALRHAGRTYRNRANHLAESVNAMLPALLLLCVGGITAVFYALVVFGPMASLWHNLAVPSGSN